MKDLRDFVICIVSGIILTMIFIYLNTPLDFVMTAYVIATFSYLTWRY